MLKTTELVSGKAKAKIKGFYFIIIFFFYTGLCDKLYIKGGLWGGVVSVGGWEVLRLKT